VDFRLLQTRLVSHVRSRVRNGEISERGLARITGISQPHIHNVLKGTRLLSIELADQVLQRLRIDLADLLTAADTPAGRPPAHTEAGGYGTVALLDGWIGRGHPYPRTAGLERYPFPAADLARMGSPVAARLAADPLRSPLFNDGGVVLLDRSESVRRDPDEEGYFAVDLCGGGTIGFVRRVRRRLHLWVCHADGWQSLALPDRSSLEVIQGRVSRVVMRL
jgi:hypothetical protein